MQPRQPHQYPRRVLLAVTGLSPQVVTETLYALAVTRTPAFVPTEIHVVTTSEGAERVRLLLLSREPGWFHRLRAEYALPQIDFDESSIHVLPRGDGTPVDDIREPADNESLADLLTRHIRALTADPDCALHVSIAGGRKTMGFYAGYTLSLFARPQDRLSHVLVTPRFESNPDFFYPSRERRVIIARDNQQSPLDTSRAEVMLADIPLVRLREGLPQRLLDGSASFVATVRAAQQTTAQPRLLIDYAARRVVCGEEMVPLPPAALAFYGWVARRRKRREGPVHWRDDGCAEAYLAEYRQIVGAHSGAFEKTEHALADGMDKDYFDQSKSRTLRQLRKALAGTTLRSYQINAHGKRPNTRFGLDLPAGCIEFGSLKSEHEE